LYLLLSDSAEDDDWSRRSLGGKGPHIGPVALEPAWIRQIEVLG
jgi:hypothetical protein